MYLQSATKAVLEAGEVIRNISENNKIEVNFKPDGSAQTNADIIAEDIIKKELITSFPEHGFIGEESDNKSDKEYVWVCDPIDGTWSYINGEYTSAISLSLRKNNKTITSIVYNPILDHLFTVAENQKPLFNNREIPLQKHPEAANIVNFQISASKKKDIDIIYKLVQENKLKKTVSTGGSPAYNLALVAAGIHAGFIVSGNSPYSEWDIAAGIYLIEKSGGKVELLNNELVLIAATNKPFFNELKTLVKNSGFGN
jgi:myo-inositol-1(or 4)-monophosphatase